MIAHEKAAGMLDTSEAAHKTTHPEFTPEKQTFLIAKLALAGHTVHRGQHHDFLVCKYGMSRHCEDFAELQTFAKLLGVKSC